MKKVEILPTIRRNYRWVKEPKDYIQHPLDFDEFCKKLQNNKIYNNIDNIKTTKRGIWRISYQMCGFMHHTKRYGLKNDSWFEAMMRTYRAYLNACLDKIPNKTTHQK